MCSVLNRSSSLQNELIFYFCERGVMFPGLNSLFYRFKHRYIDTHLESFLFLLGFGERLLTEVKKLAPKDVKIKVGADLWWCLGGWTDKFPWFTGRGWLHSDGRNVNRQLCGLCPVKLCLCDLWLLFLFRADLCSPGEALFYMDRVRTQFSESSHGLTLFVICLLFFPFF